VYNGEGFQQRTHAQRSIYRHAWEVALQCEILLQDLHPHYKSPGGKKVDERYTEVQQFQHYGDPRVFDQSYVANTSPVNGRAALLDEKVDQLDSHPQLLELEEQLRDFSCTNEEAAKETKRNIAGCRKILKRLALRRYQETWVRERRH